MRPQTTAKMDVQIPENVLKDPVAMAKLLSGVKSHMGMLDGQIAIYQKQAYHNKMQANMMKELYESLAKKLEKVEKSQDNSEKDFESLRAEFEEFRA